MQQAIRKFVHPIARIALFLSCKFEHRNYKVSRLSVHGWRYYYLTRAATIPQAMRYVQLSYEQATGDPRIVLEQWKIARFRSMGTKEAMHVPFSLLMELTRWILKHSASHSGVNIPVLEHTASVLSSNPNVVTSNIGGPLSIFTQREVLPSLVWLCGTENPPAYVLDLFAQGRDSQIFQMFWQKGEHPVDALAVAVRLKRASTLAWFQQNLDKLPQAVLQHPSQNQKIAPIPAVNVELTVLNGLWDWWQPPTSSTTYANIQGENEVADVGEVENLVPLSLRLYWYFTPRIIPDLSAALLSRCLMRLSSNYPKSMCLLAAGTEPDWTHMDFCAHSLRQLVDDYETPSLDYSPTLIISDRFRFTWHSLLLCITPEAVRSKTAHWLQQHFDVSGFLFPDEQSDFWWGEHCTVANLDFLAAHFPRLNDWSDADLPSPPTALGSIKKMRRNTPAHVQAVYQWLIQRHLSFTKYTLRAMLKARRYDLAIWTRGQGAPVSGQPSVDFFAWYDSFVATLRSNPAPPPPPPLTGQSRSMYQWQCQNEEEEEEEASDGDHDMSSSSSSSDSASGSSNNKVNDEEEGDDD